MTNHIPFRITNLKMWSTNEHILDLSLSLLKGKNLFLMWNLDDHMTLQALDNKVNNLDKSLCSDLSLGYTAVRKLFRLPDIQLLLNNHTVCLSGISYFFNFLVLGWTFPVFGLQYWFCNNEAAHNFLWGSHTAFDNGFEWRWGCVCAVYGSSFR